jgi:hypothetical protein
MYVLYVEFSEFVFELIVLVFLNVLNQFVHDQVYQLINRKRKLLRNLFLNLRIECVLLFIGIGRLLNDVSRLVDIYLFV